MQVDGGEYPPAPEKKLIATCLQYIQYALLFVLFAGDWLFQKLNIAPPAIYLKAKENKTIAFIVIFFVGSNLIGAFLQTGAFEIYFDGNKIFSKLDSGRLPALNEIEDAITRIVRFYEKEFE